MENIYGYFRKKNLNYKLNRKRLTGLLEQLREVFGFVEIKFFRAKRILKD